MLEQPTAMHVARIKSSHTGRQGRRREYEPRLLRRTYREDGKVRHETLANLTKLPGHVVDAVEAALKGDALTAAQGKATKLKLSTLCQGVSGTCRQLRIPTCPVPPGANGSTRAVVMPDTPVLTSGSEP